MKAGIVDIRPVSVAVLQQKFMYKTMMQSGAGAGYSFPVPVLSVKFQVKSSLSQYFIPRTCAL